MYFANLENEAYFGVQMTLRASVLADYLGFSSTIRRKFSYFQSE